MVFNGAPVFIERVAMYEIEAEELSGRALERPVSGTGPPVIVPPQTVVTTLVDIALVCVGGLTAVYKLVANDHEVFKAEQPNGRLVGS